jgi:Flp pilus assembly protein TadD
MFNTENYDEAIEALTRAIEIKPDYGPAYLVRSQALDQVGEHDAATIDFSKAMDLRNMETRNDKVVDY